ncbi:hypothetical protein [Ornithinimicrobium sp. W1665]|uniref:hypothetical protein n=1 Tax=Ornithinimicrobium sp. W1665 TaxID=3416666 RepID=UPI003CEDE6E8
MQSEPSWVMLAVAVLLVAGLTALAAWLAVTEARAVRPVPAGRGRRSVPDPPSTSPTTDSEKGTK